jgi:hypothetical protein
MGFSDKLKDLEKRKADLVAREKELSSERTAALRRLPSDFGFSTLEAFVGALREAHRGSGKGRGPGRPPARPERRRRAKITEETRAAVRKLVESDKTGAAIAKELKISLPSVQNIKKSLGLVKARAKSGS